MVVSVPYGMKDLVASDLAESLPLMETYFFTKKKVSTPSQLVSPDSKFNLQRKQCEVSSLLLFTHIFDPIAI